MAPRRQLVHVPMAMRNEDRYQLFVVSYPSGEISRMTNDLSDYRPQISITRDGQYLVALDRRRDAHIWAAPQGQTAQARQLTSGDSSDDSPRPGPSGKIIFRSHGNDIYAMNADGSQRAPLISDAQNNLSLSACGDRYIIFDRFLGNKIELWRADADGSNAIKLADNPRGSECSPDGASVFFFNPDNLSRIPIEGGTPTAVPNIAPVDIGAFRISPDGKSIAMAYEEGRPIPTDKFALVPIGGGAFTNIMPAPRSARGLSLVPRRQSPAICVSSQRRRKHLGATANRRPTQAGDKFHLRYNLRFQMDPRRQDATNVQRHSKPRRNPTKQFPVNFVAPAASRRFCVAKRWQKSTGTTSALVLPVHARFGVANPRRPNIQCRQRVELFTQNHATQKREG